MRPTPGGDPATEMSRSRKSSIVDSTAPYAPGPTAFFLARQEDVDKMRNGATKDGGEEYMSASSVEKSTDSVYGVQSLESALGNVFGAKSTDSSVISRHENGEQAEGGAQAENETPSIVSSPGRKAHGVSGLGHYHQQSSTVSQPLTPLQTASPALDWSSNMPSTPKSGSLGSLRLSDGDSQVGVEDCGDEENRRSGTVELVMPSLAMPARRPFTERGKRIGRLKVCVVGRQGNTAPFTFMNAFILTSSAGVGKTSLIRAIVHQCEDIVHVDPLTTSALLSPSTRPGKSKGKADRARGSGTSLITEISASTRSFPSWWADMEESKTMRRRRSSGDTVLERNLCFVDTPGIQTSSSLDADLEFLVQYIEESFWRNDALAEMTETERLNLLSGNGGTLIDAVLFIFSGGKLTYNRVLMSSKLTCL
jgi:hypothetical protein